jgi:hypothetical protein
MSRPGAPAGAAFDAETVMSPGGAVERPRPTLTAVQWLALVSFGVSPMVKRQPRGHIDGYRTQRRSASDSPSVFLFFGRTLSDVD